MFMRDLFTIFFCPKGPSSGSIHIKITRKNYWVWSDPHRNETSFLQLILSFIYHLPIITSVTIVNKQGVKIHKSIDVCNFTFLQFYTSYIYYRIE